MFFRTSTIALAGLALCALTTGSPAQAPSLDTVRVATGLARPLFVTAIPGDSQRAFIVEQRTNGAVGQIRILDITTNTLAPAPYLSIAGGVSMSGCGPPRPRRAAECARASAQTGCRVDRERAVVLDPGA